MNRRVRLMINFSLEEEEQVRPAIAGRTSPMMLRLEPLEDRVVPVGTDHAWGTDAFVQLGGFDTHRAL